MLPQTIPKSADKILGSNPTQSSSSSSTSQPENQTVSKTFEVYLSVTALSKKLMALAFSANSEDPAQRDEQLQLLMDKLKQWTDDLNNLSANCGSVSTIPDRPVSAILAPTVQNGLSVMPGRMLMQKLCTGEQSISRAAINIGTTANVRVVQALHPTTLASAPPPRLRPAAFRISDGAGVCGITVGRTGTAKVQQRRERLLVRRIPPSNAYLSAGSKLYQQHQQHQQQQHQSPRVPPSNAYLSAGTKLAIRQQQMQQQRLKRLQHHLAGIGSSSSTVGGISSTSATTASSFSSTSSSATAPIALTLRSAVVQQKHAGNIEQMQTEQQ
uniref:Uncharacterized protein n=1 Tax=Globodera pallida TaxID=36090 RepID=A0A183BSR6_GLOPA